MSVPPMRWTGLLLAILVFIPAPTSAQASGRVVRSSGTAKTGVPGSGGATGSARIATRRAIGAAAVRGHGTASLVERATSPVASTLTTGAAHRYGTARRPAQADATVPQGRTEAGEAGLVAPVRNSKPVHQTATLAWKPGGIRITGWTSGNEDSRGNLHGTVIRPDCGAEGLNAACVPENLYETPRPSDTLEPIVIAVPLFGLIYPLSYSYYYGLPFPPLALSLASLEVGGTPCVQTPQSAAARRMQQRRRSSRLFGWLYRSVRNVDMEKSVAPHLFYLRSPLLAGFGDDMDCPPEADTAAAGTETCSTITIRAEKEAPRIAQVALPVLDAENSTDLRETLESRLDAGEAIVLSTLDGKAILLSPHHVRALDVRPCLVRDDGADDDMPPFAY